MEPPGASRACGRAGVGGSRGSLRFIGRGRSGGQGGDLLFISVEMVGGGDEREVGSDLGCDLPFLFYMIYLAFQVTIGKLFSCL